MLVIINIITIIVITSLPQHHQQKTNSMLAIMINVVSHSQQAACVQVGRSAPPPPPPPQQHPLQSPPPTWRHWCRSSRSCPTMTSTLWRPSAPQPSWIRCGHLWSPTPPTCHRCSPSPSSLSWCRMPSTSTASWTSWWMWVLGQGK